ncbi:MAG: D-aminoacylase [Planctomycetota bacterium]
MFDILIQNGAVVDGTGFEGVQADIAVAGDRIAAIGSLQRAEARERIDAAGKIVCPGFVDTHNHADARPHYGVRVIPHADNLIRQGITTTIAGHCGGASYPIDKVFIEVEALRFHSNFALLVGYPSVKAMARPGKPPGNPTDEETVEIQKLLRKSMEAGAVGMSTGPIGQPQSIWSTQEFIEASKVVAEYDGVYDSHIRDEGEWGRHIEAIEEVVAISREAGVSAQISHIKLWGRKAWGDADRVMQILNDANRQGCRVNCDQYPYHGGYRGVSGLLFALQKDYTKEQLFGDKKDAALEEIRYQFHQLGGSQNVILCPYDGDPELNGKTIRQVAEAHGQSEEECAWELCKKGNLSACWLAMREEDVRAFMRCPHVMVGTDGHLREPNDGHCHPRNYGTYPRLLGRYVRDEKVLSLPQAVHKMTQQPAEKYGIKRRGVLKEGCFADIVVFDPETIIDHATWFEPHQYCTGIEHVLVNGRFAVRDGQTTDERPGRVLRRGG